MNETERNLIVQDVTKQVDYVINEFLYNVDSLIWMTHDGKNAVHKKGNLS